MKLILIIFCILLFIGSLVVKLNYEVSPFWNGFVLGGLIFSPIIALLYALNIIKTRQKR